MADLLRELGVPEGKNTPGIRYVLFDWRESEKKYHAVKAPDCNEPKDMSSAFPKADRAGSYKISFGEGGPLKDYPIAGYSVLKAAARKCLEVTFTCGSAPVDNR